MHAGGESGTGRRGANLGLGLFWVKSARRRIIRDFKWVEWILDRHTNAIAAAIAVAAYSEWMSRVRKYVWRKRRRRPGAVPETAHVLEVGKQLQVLTVDFAIKR